MNAQRVFVSLTDEQLNEMALDLITHKISRDDFCRLCEWLSEGIRLTDCSPDPTLSLLVTLTGKVTETQRMLLQVALFKWIGIIQTFILDHQHNLVLAAGNPVQSALPLMIE